MDNKEKKHGFDFAGAIVGGGIFISAGVLLLLNNSGVVSWEVWLVLLRFWPVLLILAGIQMIASRNMVASILAALLCLAIMLAVIALAVSAVTPEFKDRINLDIPWWNQLQESMSLEQVNTTLQVKSEDYPTVSLRDVTVDINFGELLITDNEDSEHLVTESIHPETSGIPEIAAEEDAGTLLIDFGTTSKAPFNFFEPGGTHKYSLDFGNPDLPTSLNLKMSAGKSVLDFDRQQLKELDLKMTAGELNATFAEDSLPEHMKLKITAGNSSLIIPEGIGLDVTYDVTAGTLKVDDQNIRGDGGFSTKDFEEAEKKMTLEIEMTAGSVTIIRTENSNLEPAPSQEITVPEEMI